MSVTDQDFDFQPGSETSMLLDPSYLEFAARCDAETDYDKGISMYDGIARLVVGQNHAGVVVSKAEIVAYGDSYSLTAFRALKAVVVR